MKISNAKDKKLTEISSGVPDVGAAIQEILQPTIAIVIQKQQIAGRTKEIRINIETQASIQPLEQKLAIKLEGQRAWKYWKLYCLNNLDLRPDQGFLIKGQGYRVVDKEDWSAYGMFIYVIIEDYSISPNPTEDEDAT